MGKTVGMLALLWTAALPARALPIFNKEAGVAVASAAAQAFAPVTAGVPYPLRMYYLPAVSSAAPQSSAGTALRSATSVDGLAWTPEAGARMDVNTAPSVSASSITGCALLPLAGGGFRMLYSIVSATGAFRIHSATSADGLAWANESSVAVDGASTTYVGAPRLAVLNSGDWRLYYTRDIDGGDDLADRRIFSALSSDEGATWGASALVLSTTAYESGVAKLTDGKIRLFYSQPPGPGSSSTVIMSVLSDDALGASFTAEAGARLSTSVAAGAVSFPVPVRSTDSFRWRLYYAYYAASSSTGDVRSALTAAPAPVSMSPATVYQSAGAFPLAIRGEIFSPAPSGLSAVSISRGVVTVAGVSVSRADDQNISATFATQGLALGSWDLTVTNADGVSATAPGVLTIDFAPGTVDLTGNLLRPREGAPTSINTTIFASGRVSVRVYDSDGRPVRTLFDGERGSGAFTLTWDGKNASGAPAPSGLYFVAVNGPKLAAKSKIVLIR